jgi:molybdopterin molybdotransferase
MIEVDEACSRVAGGAAPLGAETIGLAQAGGRRLAAAVVARHDAPALPVSAMDGYAVRDSDLADGPRVLRLAGASFAGSQTPAPLLPGTCLRIFTGAPLPQGADRVVMQEEVEALEGAARFPESATSRSHVRPAGSDFRAGDVLVPAGAVLTPQRLVAAAAADMAQLQVWRRPRVAILATGDELVEPGGLQGRAGAICESVSFGVAALAEAWGAEVVSRGRCRDDLESLQVAATSAVAIADVVVTTGGASVGERDFARAMFEPLGLELLFAKVAMKPGKPIWIGRVGTTFIVGLPGNPTSALVTARLFLAPLLAGLAGADPHRAWVWRRLPLAAAIGCAGDREAFALGRCADAGVQMLAVQDSASQRSLGEADLLIRRRPGASGAAAGEPVECLSF